MRHFLIAAALVCCGNASAASVVKCVDAAGKLTFVQNECPPGLVGEEHDVKAPQRPSGGGQAVKLADPSKTYIKKEPRPVRRAAPVSAAAPAQDVVEQAPAPRGGVVRQHANQPCVRWVEKMVTSSKKMADGSRRGRAEIIKVPVPC